MTTYAFGNESISLPLSVVRRILISGEVDYGDNTLRTTHMILYSNKGCASIAILCCFLIDMKHQSKLGEEIAMYSSSFICIFVTVLLSMAHKHSFLYVQPQDSLNFPVPVPPPFFFPLYKYNSPYSLPPCFIVAVKHRFSLLVLYMFLLFFHF